MRDERGIERPCKIVISLKISVTEGPAVGIYRWRIRPDARDEIRAEADSVRRVGVALRHIVKEARRARSAFG